MKASFILLLSLIATGHTFASIWPDKLTCASQVHPMGIDFEHPAFSWTLQADERSQVQSAYELIVSDNIKLIQGATGNCWQSGKINTAASIQQLYDGSPLKSFTTYYWRVRVYDGRGSLSDWSSIASFETAALQPADWTAAWIGDGSSQFTSDADFYQDDPMPLFRRNFYASKKIAAARLYLCGLGYAEAYINDQKVGEHVLDPGFTAYGKEVLYTVHDVTALIKARQRNTVGIMLGNGWYNPLPLKLFGRFNLRDVQETGRPCLTAILKITYANGVKETIVTDETWQCAQGPILRNSVYLGEVYDARKEIRFADTAGWKQVVKAKGPSGVLQAQQQPPVGITRVLTPTNIRELGKDTFMVDMGQNFAGVAAIRVHGKAGQRITVRYGEDTLSNGRLNYFSSTAGHIKEIWKINGGEGAPATAWQQDTYISKDDRSVSWHPRFTFHVFRYLEITGWPGRPSPQDIQGLRMNSAVENNGSFSCSNDLFNSIHTAVQWTFLSNLFSIQSDCAGREKMGYGADMVVSAQAFMYNYDMHNFYAKSVRDFFNDQQPDGGITEIAPYTGIADRGYGGESGPLGWELAFPYLQKQLYDFYGDKQIIAHYYPAFKKQMAFLQAKAIQGLFHWDIGDHEALDPKAEAFSASCFYYHHALLAAEFAGILHDTTGEKKYISLAALIKKSIVNKYMVTGTGRFDNATQAAQIFALWYHISPEEDSSFNVLLHEYERHNWHLSTGIFSTMMMFDLLRERDANDLAVKIAGQTDFPGWGYMLGKGATTLWESWKYPEQNSMNHPMFGSIDSWFYKSLLGIMPAAPGFSKIIIKPQTALLSWAKGSYDAVCGTIESSWIKKADMFELKVGIPANTSAEVWLPANERQVIKEHTRLLNTLSDIKLLRYEKGYAVLQVGSGNYQFVAAD